MRLLFLDIDGVLNTHELLDPEVMCGQIHKDKVVLLNEVLRQTGAKIALSSQIYAELDQAKQAQVAAVLG